MACKVGTVAANTGSVTTTVTGLGFQPQAIIIWAISRIAADADSLTSNALNSIGFSDGTNHRSVANAGTRHSTPTANGRQYSATKVVIIITDGVPTIANQATVAFTSDGFTLTWDTTPVATYEIGYMAVAGIISAFVGDDTLPTSTGTKTVSNVGFKGDFILALSSSQTSVGTAVEVHQSMGAAVSSSKRFSNTIATDTGQSGAGPNGTAQVTHCLTKSTTILDGLTAAGVLEFAADFTGFTSTGFVLNVITAPPAAYKFAYLVIKGGYWDLGVVASASTNIAQSVTGEVIKPEGLMLSSVFDNAINTIEVGSVIWLGAATLGSQFATEAWWNQADNNDAYAHSTAKIFTDIVIPAAASFTSFNNDGWTITWSANLNIGGGSQICWFVLGNQLPALGGVIGAEYIWGGGDSF